MSKFEKANSRLMVTYRAVGDLVPAPRNARTHSTRQIAQIKASIEAFGFTNPILVDPEDHVIAGHGRLKAARVIGLMAVPTIVLSGLTQAQKQALRIADNKIALNAGWDLEILRLELSELTFLDVAVDPILSGFSTGEIEAILTPCVGTNDDVFRTSPVAARTKPGDVWILGEHRVGCGDSRDADFLQRVIGRETLVDAAFLDPLYNLRIGETALSSGRHRDFAMGASESEVKLRSFLADTLGAAARYSRSGAIHFVCMDWRHMDSISATCRTVYGELLDLCVWGKSDGGKGSLYRSSHELVFVYRVGKGPYLEVAEGGKHGRNRTNVWDHARVDTLRGGLREDPALRTVKPTGLVADAILDVTRPGDLVLDVFLGFGTTLMAAERSGRRLRGLDIDPVRVDVAIERWSSRTGLAPQLEECVP